MPRFENEGFNANNNRDLDRTVPPDENYYGAEPLDFNFNNKESSRDDIVVDRQARRVQNENQHFQSERFEDFDTGRNESVRRSRSPEPPKKRGTKRNTKRNTAKKIIALALILIIVLVGSVFPVLARMNYDEKKDNEFISASELESSKSVKNILLLGVDARSNEDAESSRSDAMMLISFDTKHHCIKTTSFLRDTWVYIPSLGYEQRLNAACSDGGYSNVVDTIEYNFGVDIDGYVVADFEMFKVLVDSIGGVKVDITEKEANEVTKHPKRYGDVTLEQGENILTGEQALAYCRIRKIDTDFERTKRQRTVIKAVVGKAKVNPLKLYKMAFNSAPYLETDLSKGELASLAGKASLCITGKFCQQKVPFDDTWDYATIRGNSVITINKEKNKDMLIDYIYNQSPSDIEE